MCLDLLIVIKHVYNCHRFFKAADHKRYMWVWEHVVQYIMERVLDEKERKESTRWRMSSLLLPLQYCNCQVPFDPVELEMNNKTQGLVSPEAFQLPPISPLWTPVAYAAFDESKLTGKVSPPFKACFAGGGGTFYVQIGDHIPNRI